MDVSTWVLRGLFRVSDWAPKIRRVFLRIADYSQGLEYGSYDLSDEAALAVGCLPPGGGLVVDVGANAGEYSRAVLLEARRASVSVGGLLLVEPNDVFSADHERLRESFREQIESEWIALGAETAEMQLHFNTDRSTLSSLYRRKLGHLGIGLSRSKTVRVEPLSEVARRRGIERIDFLKLDVEGHELDALKGARSLLEGQAIRSIQFEFGGAHIDSRVFLKDIWDLLHNEMGYRLLRLLPGRTLEPIREYSESLERFSWQNFLACAPDVRPPWRLLHQRGGNETKP